MLVLTRKTEQKIFIGRDITVTILRIRGRTVKIGIEAPSGTEVLRSELLGKGPRLDPSAAASDGPSPAVLDSPSMSPARRRRAPRDPHPSHSPPVSGVGPALLSPSSAARPAQSAAPHGMPEIRGPGSPIALDPRGDRCRPCLAPSGG